MSYSPLFRGNSSTGTASGSQSGYQNGTGSTMPIGTAVSQNTSGQIVLTDVSNEALSEAWLGVCAVAIPSAATGGVATDGRIQNIPSALGFANGDPIWVGPTPGSLTNVKPDVSALGWAEGDFVLFVGVVVQNEFNPSLQDIQLCRQIIGQL
jgi:hypothetical protein